MGDSLKHNSKSRKKFVDEVLRFCHILVDMKCNSEDDKNIKRLIKENLIEIAKIDKALVEKRQQNKIDKEILKHSACF